ncbi:NUDIX domain-containing protein [Cellulomonas sp. HZM]|uniref:NUDIX domain-containing protein n=1 Tax=Cellulomonas sp. HZM TaxID=1454010 RepID=UPI0004931B65|nr:NUDIX domain-containing protein [Cellulomonas sp. HZM]
MPRTSAGLLLFRREVGTVEVLVGHLGGPFWARKDAGAWTVPKGELEGDEEPFAAALREFAEETGAPAPPGAGPDLDLGEIRQGSGKVVRAWAREATLDATALVSNAATIEWPPRSGRSIEVPELDRFAWVRADEVGPLLVAGQAELVDRLVAALG